MSHPESKEVPDLQYCDDLFTALRIKEFEEFKKCLEMGGDPCVRDEWGHTLLHEAIRDGKLRLVEYLLNNTPIDVNTKNYHFRNTPLILATQCGRLDFMKLLVEKGANINDVDRNGSSCLHFAINQGHIHITKFLIKMEADLNVINVFSDTPLSTALWNHDATAVKLLLKHGANVNRERPMCIPLFHEAILHSYGELRILELLYRFGADPNQVDESKMTPMHYAALVGYVNIARFLVEIQANVEPLDALQRTPLDIARIHQNHNMVKFLKCLKSSINTISPSQSAMHISKQ